MQEGKTAEKTEKSSDDGFSSMTEKLRTNPWIVSTLVLGLFALVLLFFMFKGGITGNVISETDIESKFLDFAGAQGVSGVEIVAVENSGSYYDLTYSLNGQVGHFYITKDGEYFAPVFYPLTGNAVSDNEETPKEVPKSDKPVAELFIWSYCPYGVTALTPFAEVAKILGNSAEFKVRLYYDGHGEHETQQNKIQACIQKYDKTKYWDYAINFASKVYTKCSGNAACDKSESTAIMKSLGIDSNKILTCVESEGESLIGVDSQRAGAVGISGSPSLVINNVFASVARNAEAYKQAVCSAFNTAPSGCSQTMSSSQATASGSCG